MAKKVLFFGTDAFAVRCLETLYQHIKPAGGGLLSHLEVVCPPPTTNPSRRKSAASTPLTVQRRASELGLQVHNPPSRSSLDGWELPSKEFDIGVVVSFGYFLPARIINAFPLGMINAHPSLLPKYRGAAPMQHAILNKDKETGVCIIEVHPKRWDAGKILNESKILLGSDVTYPQLSDQLSTVAANLLVETIAEIDQRRINGRIQDDSLSKSFRAPKIEKEMGNVDWSKMTADDVYVRWRALNSTGVFSSMEGKRIKFGIVSPPRAEMENSENAQPGDSVFKDDILWIKCSEGWAGVEKLQMEGKEMMNARSFVNGFGLGRKFSPVAPPESK